MTDATKYQFTTPSVRLRREMAPLESDGKVIGEMTSNIIIASC
jgi:hypothetical protein